MLAALLERLLPHRALRWRAPTPKPPSSICEADLAGAEIDAAVGDQIERGDALRHARGMVEVRRKLHDAVAEADALRALAAARKTSGAEECEYSSRK